MQGGTFQWSELEAGEAGTGEPPGAAGGLALDMLSSSQSTESAGQGAAGLPSLPLAISQGFSFFFNSLFSLPVRSFKMSNLNDTWLR